MCLRQTVRAIVHHERRDASVAQRYPFALAQGRRIALVIGVSNYRNVPTLANTANDANSIGAALRRLGEVVEAHRRLEDGGLEGKLVLCPDLPSQRDRCAT
jgi:caspase domain-containing protein